MTLDELSEAQLNLLNEFLAYEHGTGTPVHAKQKRTAEILARRGLLERHDGAGCRIYVATKKARNLSNNSHSITNNGKEIIVKERKLNLDKY